jgi:hypothetical protein
VTGHRLQDLCNTLGRLYLGEREIAVDWLLFWQPKATLNGAIAALLGTKFSPPRSMWARG